MSGTGVLGAGREWFKPWRTIAGERLADSHVPELQVVIEGLFALRRFLDLVRDFLVFEDDGSGRLVKKVAGYHQRCAGFRSGTSRSSYSRSS